MMKAQTWAMDSIPSWQTSVRATALLCSQSLKSVSQMIFGATRHTGTSRRRKTGALGQPFTSASIRNSRRALHSASPAAAFVAQRSGLGFCKASRAADLLDKFHYLSTVSGGGYIGSWLSAWIKNHPQGIDGVVSGIADVLIPDSALNPDPQPIRHLRKFSNYLTPKTGLTSVDFWTLITTFVRNMFLNWLVLISLLGAVMMIPRFYLAAITLAPNWEGLATKYLRRTTPRS